MSFMDKLSAFASSVAETGREASHSMGFDKVGLGNDVYMEDDSANEVMTKVNARRATVTELLSSVKDVRSSAQEGIRNNKRFYECLDAFKNCTAPPEKPSIASGMTFDLPTWGSDETAPTTITFLYEELAEDIAESYKINVRPLKEDYKKQKLSYKYNQTQLTERRFKEGTEDSKTKGYEESMKTAETTWKEISIKLQAAAQDWIATTDGMLATAAGKAAIISSYYALSQASSALAAAQLMGVPIGDPTLIDTTAAAIEELSAKAKDLNLQISFDKVAPVEEKIEE